MATSESPLFHSLSGSTVLASVFLIALCWVIYRVLSAISCAQYPPGPPGKGLLSGNLEDLVSERSWLTYIEMGKKYGNILHLRAYHKHTIVLNTYEDSVELLEKRSATFSDRPYLPVIDLMGWLDFNVGFMPYGPQWKLHRSIYQRYFKADVSLKYEPLQTRKISDFLYSILTAPESFSSHYRTLAAAVVMSIMYAHDVSPEDDYFVGLAEKVMSQLSARAPPGASFFYAIPMLRHIPAWFPGAGFKRFILEGRSLTNSMRNAPIEIVKARIKNGNSPDCVAAELLESCRTEEQYKAVTGVAATGYAAGSDTTVSSLGTFFHAMARFPDVQIRAQQEIDAIVGSERLVTHEDRQSLVYVQALYREVMRWRPVLPLCVPHQASAGDTYKGYNNPKGTSVITNIWAISHDPERYPNPDNFDPSRFIDQKGELNSDDMGYAFGFGRRICPGRHVASSTVWLAIATVLQNFEIHQKRDCKGEAIPINPQYTNGLVIHPMPFECSITPRSEEAKRNILKAAGKLDEVLCMSA